MFSPAYLVKAHSEKASKVLYKFLNLKEYNRLKDFCWHKSFTSLPVIK